MQRLSVYIDLSRGRGTMFRVENGDLKWQPVGGKHEQDNKQHYDHLQAYYTRNNV